MFKNPEKIFFNSQQIDNSSSFSIIHFNDVYDIEISQGEAADGGAARFVGLIEDLLSQGPTIVVFSGDALSPSLMSTVTKGEHMIEILNKCHISCACIGNHEFDFGLDQLKSSVQGSNFPWLISNVIDIETGKPLGDIEDKKIVEINGVRIGFIGLTEESVIGRLSSIDSDSVDYEHYIDAGKRLANELKNIDKCDFVVALTHMLMKDDILLAENVNEIDLFLGGHDHEYSVKEINNRWTIKSGANFKSLTRIQLAKSESQLYVNQIEKFLIDSSVAENEEVSSIVNKYIERCCQGLDDVIGIINVDLDGRESQNRCFETNLGNFFCDILLSAVDADIALINGGSLRSNRIHKAGEIKMRDLREIMPFLSEKVLISVSGKVLLQILENGVSGYPEPLGRFLQVSGVSFAFDPEKPAGSRVASDLVKVQNEYLVLNKNYRVVVDDYIQSGKDGFECMMDCPVLVSSEDIGELANLVINHFKTIADLKNEQISTHRFNIIPRVLIDSIFASFNQNSVVEDENDELDFMKAAFIVNKLQRFRSKVFDKSQRATIKKSSEFKEKKRGLEEKAMQLSPKCENRIIVIKSEEHYQELLEAK